MTPQELKNSILQLAIQGKLVEQRPEEGTAEEFYQQIQAEKQKLIKAGKLKKEKSLPEITEDEKPFDIPESWLWVHLDNIAVSGLGKTLDKAKNKGDFKPYLCSINVYWSGIDLSKVKEARFEQDELPKYKLEKGDLLICEGGDVGRSAIWDSDDTMYYQNALHRVRFYGGIDAYFYKYLLECYKGMGIIDTYSKGMTIKHLVQSALNDMWLPLPPVTEQKRIVAKIEELLPYIDRYEKAWSKLEEFNKRFPTDMQNSILQMAIQGKLVDQRPEEGTGEELYQQIQAEKQKLIKAGTIKKEKPLPEITEDEKPFDIPESWKWVRMSEVIDVRDGTHDTPAYIPKGYPLITGKDFYFGEFDFAKTQYISESNYLEISKRSLVETGDILFSMIGGNIGSMIHITEDNYFEMAIKNVALFKQYLRNDTLSTFLLVFLKSQVGNLKAIAKGGAQAFVPLKLLRNYSFPLPPLAEQMRIVEKLDEILPLCEKLK